MAPAASEYTTKELTKTTLADFEKLFERRPAPGAFICWCMYHHRDRQSAADERRRSRVTQAARNRQQKRELVERDRSHGILVYSNGEPVGWCQYGYVHELPRFDANRDNRRLPQDVGEPPVWRITCFTVDQRHRGRGVAGTALKAATEAIRKRGGGIVEAYPTVRRGAYREYLGTISMFQKAGFEVVAPFGKNNVVMRRTI